MIEKPAFRSDLFVFAAVIAILALTGVATWERVYAARSARLWTDHTYEVLGAVRDLDVAVRDAETGQRGYLLTGKDSYLEPYQSALDRIGRMRGAEDAGDRPVDQRHRPRLQQPSDGDPRLA